MSSRALAQMETLEDRQLFSAGAAVVLAPRDAHGNVNMLGVFTGSSVSAVDRHVTSIILDVTSESRGGAISGTVITKQPGKHSHEETFTGQVSGSAFTLNIPSTGTTLTGTDTDNVLIGKYSVAGDHGTGRLTK